MHGRELFKNRVEVPLIHPRKKGRAKGGVLRVKPEKEMLRCSVLEAWEPNEREERRRGREGTGEAQASPEERYDSTRVNLDIH